MRNQMTRRKIAQALSVLMLLSVVQLPLLADIHDRIEYKVNRLLTKVDEIINDETGETYDYVIVGAGTAGCVMAYELSADKTKKVLVLEEGPNLDQDPNVLNIDFPAGNVSYQISSSTVAAAALRHTYYHEWFTVPMAGTNTPPVQNRPILYGGARCAGGTSAVNGMFHVRPSYQALNTWVSLTGDPEYGMGYIPFGTASLMTKRFVEINTYLPNSAEPQLYWHGYGTNPDQINTIFERQQDETSGGRIFADTMQAFTLSQFGVNYTPNVDTFAGPSPYPPFAAGPAYDRNNPNYPFHVSAQLPIEERSDRTRSHSSREFLLASNGDPAEFPNVPVVFRDYAKGEDVGLDGRQLKVIYNATVLNIQWDANTAKSVTYDRNGVEHRAFVKSKLILSAGINSATILLKNGVGPAAELNAVGIPVVVDSPNVGKNIQNHPLLAIGMAQAPIDGVVRTVSFRARNNNVATLTLSSVAGLAVGDWLNVSGVGGAGNAQNATGYNANAVQITSIGVPTANDVSFYNVGANEVTTANTSITTGATPSSRVIKVDQFRAGANSQGAVNAKLPYGWDLLDGGSPAASSGTPLTPNLDKLSKWGLFIQITGNALIIVPFNPASRGFIQVLKQDPLHPVQCDLRYLANASDVTDFIAIIRRMVNFIDYLRNVVGNLNYDIGTAPSRATIRGTAAPTVIGYERTAGVATLTFSAAPGTALSVGGFITVGDTIAPTTTMPDASFNSIGAPITAVTATTVSYANSGPNVAFTAIAPLAGVVLDQSGLVTFIRQALSQNHHFIGSCQMRDTFANGGVVDPYGNVFGTTNVMVCDCSSFPAQVDANTAGTVYPFALKIAQDLITGRNPLA